MKKSIRQSVVFYKKKFGTHNPFELANCLHIETQIGDLGSRSGCYMYLKRHRCIFLNSNLEEHEKNLVMAHELGHAVLHPRENCYFIRNKTLLLNSKIEIEANKFAIELLLPDEILQEYYSFTIEQVARITGYHQNLIKLLLTQSN